MNQIEAIIQELYANNQSKLHQICNKEMIKFGGISQMEYDNFYSRAGLELSLVKKKYEITEFIPTDDKTAMDYICGVIKRSIWKEMTDKNRLKRQLIIEKEEVDENGNVRKIKEYVPNLSIDAPINNENEMSFADYLYSSCNTEDEVLGDDDEKVQHCLSGLSKIQRRIIEMKMNNVSISEIKEVLELSDNQYNDNMKSIRENPNIIAFGNKKDFSQQCKKVEDVKLSNNEKNIIEVMDLDTTDSYRTDKNTLGSLLNDIEDELSPTYINRNYISQRQPFMWDEEKINKYYSRILNNQPIPELVICEQIVNGEKISYLIDGLQRLAYAEAFKKNLIPVKAKGAEFVNIKYRERCTDENGSIQIVEKIFNIVGKYYKDLPEFLQKRFDNFNMTVTRFFNCTSEMIDYHMRNYNNHVSMNKSQYGMTNVSNKTATRIKDISYNHSFFKDNVKVTNKNGKDGSWDEVVARSIMAINYIDDWKKEVVNVFKFLDENATEEQFIRLNENLNRLSVVADKSVKDLFTTTNTYIWLAVYDRFTKFGLDDIKFIEFMRHFKDLLHSKDTEEDTFIRLYKHQSTRDKKVVSGKIEGLISLMCEFLHIKKEDARYIDCIQFVKENIEDVTDEDIELFDMVANDVSESVDIDSWIISDKNRPSYLAIVGHAIREDNDRLLNEWLPIYEKNNTFELNQEQSFLHMKNSFDKFIQERVGVA